MDRCPKSDTFFSMWMTSHIAQISEYDIAGGYRPGLGRVESKEKGNNAIYWLRNIFKQWRGGRSAEIVKLCFSIFQCWDGDLEILTCLWTQWIPKLDIGSDGILSKDLSMP